ncbi:MAG: hypothetical protein HC902_04950 [Calothrix sp. SM1_5_4]|nr:hypothetical protein [Calothrix sp. SM1_5_4]
MNDYERARANYQNYFDKSRGAEKFEALLLMAKMNERRGAISKAQELYKQYYDARPRNPAGIVEAAYKVAKIHQKRGNKKDAEEWLKKVIYQQKQFSTAEKPVGVSYAAEAKFTFVYKTYDEFRLVRIPANPQKQAQAIKEKLAFLNRLKDQLKDVIRYDDGPYVVNSLALIGQAYQHMAASIYAVPIPKGLDAESEKKYKEGVDGIAKPFLEEAIKNYESAIERGFKLEGYGDGLKTAARELNRLNKDKFPDFGERAVLTKLTDYMEILQESDISPAFRAGEESMLVEACSKRSARIRMI